MDADTRKRETRSDVDKDISHEIIDLALKNVSAISTITFTGGEVTLNVDAIRYALKVCKDNDIFVGGFYMVTNGKNIPDEFLIACIEWYAYCIDCGADPEMCGVALSKDAFHETIPSCNEDLLKAFSFFRESDKDTDWNRVSLINLGLARSLTGFRKRDKHYDLDIDVQQEDDTWMFRDCTLAITVDGDVLADCDYEYSSTNDIKLGTVFDDSWIRKAAGLYEDAA